MLQNISGAVALNYSVLFGSGAELVCLPNSLFLLMFCTQVDDKVTKCLNKTQNGQVKRQLKQHNAQQ